MELWIPITVAAAFFQNLRFMLQKVLKDTSLSAGGATFARFLYGAPLAAILLAGILVIPEQRVPAINPGFLAFACVGGLAQIVATSCVVALFSERNFAVGIGFKKTETVQTAILSLLILGESVSAYGLFAILVGLVGVILMADAPPGRLTLASVLRVKAVFNRATGYGLAAGALFGVSAIGYRGATLALGEGDVLLRASLTLALVTAFQSVVMAAYLRFRQPGEITRVVKTWRVSGMVGLTSILGSLCWFVAFALQHAAYVKALGQIELIFTFAGSYLVFRERSTLREILGIVLVLVSILFIVLL